MLSGRLAKHLLASTLLIHSVGAAQLPSGGQSMHSPFSGSASPTSSIKPLDTSAKLPSQQTPPPVAQPRTPPPAPRPLIPQFPAYFHPGMLVSRGGPWEGGDNLFNLPANIGVFVEIIRPPEDPLELTEEQIQKWVADIFNGRGIMPSVLASADQPPLPFFQIQILLYPINQGYVACCEGRLFESVNLKRVIFDPGMFFQAVTWEKKTLLVAPTASMMGEVERGVVDIAKSFVDRVQAYGRGNLPGRIQGP